MRFAVCALSSVQENPPAAPAAPAAAPFTIFLRAQRTAHSHALRCAHRTAHSAQATQRFTVQRMCAARF